MPEDSSLQVFCARLEKVINKYRKKKHGRRPKARLKIFPRCFAEGTAQKSYCSAVARNEGWHNGLEPALPLDSINEWDLARSLNNEKEADWLYLLVHCLEEGELFVTIRGKEMVIACGYHAVLINFGLEAALFKISQADLNDVLSGDRPGPSNDPAKARRLRSFAVPPRLIEKHTSTTTDRHIEIFLAILIENGDAFILTDFARLVRMTFISKDRHWNETDFVIKSPSWLALWGTGRGPCWGSERGDALEGLNVWRSEVLNATTSRGSKRIVDSISDDNMYFNGFGAHMANDVLHTIGVHPATPLWYICEDEDRFSHFKNGLSAYHDIFLTQKFLRRVASDANSLNPLAYNKWSSVAFIQSFVRVYRKQPAYIPFKDWWYMHSRGLFDPYHTIGSPYVPTFAEKQKLKQEDIFVLTQGKSFKGYTCIIARCPDEWNVGEFEWAYSEHVDLAGYKTTLGAAEYSDQKKNKLNIVTFQGSSGRRPSIKTGMPGRPAKKPKIQDVRKQAEVLERRKEANKNSRIPFQLLPHADTNAEVPPDDEEVVHNTVRSSKRKRNPNPKYVS